MKFKKSNSGRGSCNSSTTPVRNSGPPAPSKGTTVNGSEAGALTGKNKHRSVLKASRLGRNRTFPHKRIP